MKLLSFKILKLSRPSFAIIVTNRHTFHRKRFPRGQIVFIKKINEVFKARRYFLPSTSCIIIPMSICSDKNVNASVGCRQVLIFRSVREPDSRGAFMLLNLQNPRFPRKPFQ